jgi:hypothetical protein
MNLLYITKNLKMKDKKNIQSLREFNENLNTFDIRINQIEKLIDEKMYELIGKDDYTEKLM